MAKKTASKSKTTTKKNDTGKALKDLFNLTLKSVEKTLKRPMWTLEEIDAKYGVSKYLSTGLPSLDMSLMHNEDRTQYGFPHGRYVEICGDSGACKTTLMNLLCAKTLSQGGMAYYIPTEFDFDVDYFNTFLADEGLEPIKKDGSSDYLFGISPSTTIKELYLTMKGIVEPLRALADEIEKAGKNPLEELPPVLIVCDSLGAMMADTNRDRLDKDWDDGDQTGAHAKELHDFFKFFLHDIARLGILFIFTNHYRANLGPGYSKKQPAHEFATAYYCSMRLRFDMGYDKANLNKTVTRMGRDFRVGFPVKVSVYKIRGEFALDGIVNIGYYHNHGFDYIGSLVDACRMSSIFVERKGVYDVGITEEEDAEIFKLYDGKKLAGYKEAKEIFTKDLPLALRFEKLAYARGVDKLEDLR